MSAGLRVFKEDGSPLFDTEKITYGLLKSGYLSLQASWPRLKLRSAQLNPTDPASWAETSPVDQIHGFVVTGAVAPIVFISGPGNTAGSSKSGDTTTFLFVGASTATKFYYFDTMRNTLTGAGLKCFDESGALTFNSLQHPLNIIAAVQPPPPGGAIAPGSPWRNLPHSGGSNINAGYNPGPSATVTVAVPGGGDLAASINFTRGCTLWGVGAYPYTAAASEGAYGTSGGVIFRFRLATRTTEAPGGATSNTLWANIPTDRYPTALVIRTENLPFPFN